MAGKVSAVYGELVGAKGVTTPIEITDPVNYSQAGGIAPERLDPVVEVLIQNAEAGAAVLLKYTPMLEALMRRAQGDMARVLSVLTPPPTQATEGEVPPPHIPAEFGLALDLANRISVILERINKMTMQSVRSKSDAIRLRYFLKTGGEEDDSGLHGLGEDELKRIVLRAANGMKTPEDV